MNYHCYGSNNQPNGNDYVKGVEASSKQIQNRYYETLVRIHGKCKRVDELRQRHLV